MQNILHGLLSIAVAGLTMSTLMGCEEDVTSILGTDGIFEIYGVLNPTADTQFVRVYPISSRLDQFRGKSIDAEVRSTHLTTGETRIWRDSLLTFEDGTHGYFYWSSFRPEGGTEYQIEVVDDGGGSTTASVHVPALPRLMAGIAPDEVMRAVRLTSPAAEVRHLEIEYWVRHFWCPGDEQRITLPYTDKVRYDAGEALVDVHLLNDYSYLETVLTRERLYRAEYGILPVRIMIRAHVTNDDWQPPGGEFDPEILVEPGVMTNVTGGFGYVGGGYVLEMVLFATRSDLLVTSDGTFPEASVANARFVTEERQRPVERGLCEDADHIM